MLSKEILQIVITMFSAQLLWSFEIYDPLPYVAIGWMSAIYFCYRTDKELQKRIKRENTD
jgi:hypothetical protein